MYSFNKMQKTFQNFTKYPICPIKNCQSFDKWKQYITNHKLVPVQDTGYERDWPHLGDFFVQDNNTIQENEQDQRCYNLNKYDKPNLDRELASIFGKSMLEYLKSNTHQSGFIECNRIFFFCYLQNKINIITNVTTITPSYKDLTRVFDITDNTINVYTKTELTKLQAIDASGKANYFIFEKPVILESNIEISKEKAIKRQDNESILSSSCKISVQNTPPNKSVGYESGYETSSQEDLQSVSTPAISNEAPPNQNYIIPADLGPAIFDDEIAIPNHQEIINIIYSFTKLKEDTNNITNIILDCGFKVENISFHGINVCSWLYQAWIQGQSKNEFYNYITENKQDLKNAITKLVTQNQSIASHKSTASDIHQHILSIGPEKFISDYRKSRKRKALMNNSAYLHIGIISVALAFSLSSIAFGLTDIRIICPVSILSIALCATLIFAFTKTDDKQQTTTTVNTQNNLSSEADTNQINHKPSSHEESVQVTQIGNVDRITH